MNVKQGSAAHAQKNDDNTYELVVIAKYETKFGKKEDGTEAKQGVNLDIKFRNDTILPLDAKERKKDGTFTKKAIDDMKASFADKGEYNGVKAVPNPHLQFEFRKPSKKALADPSKNIQTDDKGFMLNSQGQRIKDFTRRYTAEQWAEIEKVATPVTIDVTDANGKPIKDDKGNVKKNTAYLFRSTIQFDKEPESDLHAKGARVPISTKPGSKNRVYATNFPTYDAVADKMFSAAATAYERAQAKETRQQMVEAEVEAETQAQADAPDFDN